MKIVILGPNGMLGQMAVRYFVARGYDVVTISQRFDFTASCPGLAQLAAVPGDALVLNCVGRIKQKDSDRSALFDVNATLPLQLYERLGAGHFLIHPSTDCVFAGDKLGRYRVDDAADAQDDYGWSKRLGEVALAGKPRAATIRVSIIGLDCIDQAPRGLLGWFLTQADGAVLNGYANHIWNGITTFEWCRQVEQLFILAPDPVRNGTIIQLGTEDDVSKYDMLCQFQQVFETNYTIKSCNTVPAVNRALEPHYYSEPLRQQLVAMKEFVHA